MKQREAQATVIAELRPILMQNSFRRRRTSWYRYDPQFLQMLDVSVGQRAVLAKVGAMYRPLSHATHPDIGDCHISIGLGSVIPPEVDWSSVRAYGQWMSKTDDRIKTLVEILRTIGLPLLDQWRSEASVREFLQSPLASRATLRLEFVEGFSLQGRPKEA